MTIDPPATEVGDAAPAGGSATGSRRIALGYLALAAPAIAFTADTMIALARGWRVDSRADRALLIVAGLWLVTVTAALLVPVGRRFFANKFAQLIALSVSVCGVLVVFEIVLGPILADLGDPFHLRKPGLEMVYYPQPGIMRDVGPETHATFNSWGTRGSEPPPREQAYRILCLGGSSTACTYLDDPKTWPQLLESYLATTLPPDPSCGYWVANAGRPGYRSAAHQRFVERSPLVDRVDCIVVQAGFNDFMSCLAGPRPTPLWTRSFVWQPARNVVRRSMTTGTLVQDKAGTVYERRRAVRQAAAIDTSRPALEECLERFAANVRGIIDACRQRNVRVVFTTQPALWRVDLDEENAALLWFGKLADGRYLSIERLRAGLDRYNGLLREVCRERGVELVDLSVLDGDPAVFYDDAHFTETGADRLARLLADWFVEHPARTTEQPSP